MFERITSHNNQALVRPDVPRMKPLLHGTGCNQGETFYPWLQRHFVGRSKVRIPIRTQLGFKTMIPFRPFFKVNHKHFLICRYHIQDNKVMSYLVPSKKFTFMP